MRNSTSKKSPVKKVVIIILAVFIILLAAMGIYLSIYYKAVDVEASLRDTSDVSVTMADSGYFFDGPGDTTIYYFYPGAKVQTESYAPLMHMLAENGIV